MLISEQSFQKELEDALIHYQKDLKSIRSGKASPADFEHIKVEAYGGETPLNAVGQVIVEDAMNVKVTVWDKSIIPAVEKALREGNLGGSVAVDRDFIRIKFLPMTEEDRKKRVKEVGDITEQYRVRVRQVRQKYMKEIDGMDGVSEDDQERDTKAVQKKIDETIEKIDSIASQKEKELLQI